MSLDIKQWEEAKQVWGNVKKQAIIDQAQAELYLSAIDKKIEELKALEGGQNGG